jgi:hypothetical protein
MGASPYTMTIDLNVLNHLGIGLYSNIPAVVSETVANAWDADATKVEIDVDAAAGRISITDDGFGMSLDDLNSKYLTIGYRKRDNDGAQTPMGRHVMGRKGIGKLSLFSIANTIEVHSVTVLDDGRVQKSGLVMTADGVKEAMEAGGRTYHPVPVNEGNIEIESGTAIYLSDLKLGAQSSESFLRRRLARRFSVIGERHDFDVCINGEPIGVEDRDYFSKLEYLWVVGPDAEHYLGQCPNCKNHIVLDGVVDAGAGLTLSGWVGTFDEQKSIEEGNNSIVLLAWGKLVHEDLLADLKEGGIYTKYLIGEIRADFLDADDQPDIATSDRQHLKEQDPRFDLVKQYVQKTILKSIESKWRAWRREEAEKRARTNPKVDEWFRGLGKDNQKYARELFARIESFPVEDPDYKKLLYKHGILAFETLALNQNLCALDQLADESDFAAFSTIFAEIDALEQAHYYQIVKGRLAVLERFEDLADQNAKERVVQQHIFDHLWLLDPSWERATTDERMEESVTKEFANVDAGLREDEKAGRIDIRYKTVAGKHVIIELKRYRRKVDVYELAKQIDKYRSALEKCLKAAGEPEPYTVESICIVGDAPGPSDNRKTVIEVLRAVGARYMTYDELIIQTRHSYREYIDANKEIGRIHEIVENL